MASCRRRSLTSSFNHLNRRLRLSFVHILRDDREPTEPPNLLPLPPVASRRLHASAFAPSFPGPGDPRGLAFSLPLGLDPCLLRSYSSSAEGSDEADYSEDVSEVLSDGSLETAAAATDVVAPAPFPGEVAAAAVDSFLPVAALQHLIDSVHALSGLNWWASIALTTVLIRGATIPLLLNQLRVMVKLNMMRPELEQFTEQIDSMDPQSAEEGQKQVKALFQKYGVTPFTPLKGLFIQGPIFISFFFA